MNFSNINKQISDNSKPLLTVAMAVYNGARFINETIENILNQTYKDYELLIIDDGSTDKSREIATYWAKKDHRIRLLFKEKNDGISVVRNISIQEARGKYLLMLDSDDLMEPNALEIAIKEAQEKDLDVVLWYYDTFYNNKKYKINNPILKKDSIITKKDLLKLPGFLWIRLFRTQYLKEKNISFPKGLTKHDIPAHWKIITDLNVKISFIPKVLFHYRQHPFAISQKKDKSLFSLIKIMDIVKDNLIKDHLYLEYKNEFLRHRLSLMHGAYDFIIPEFKSQVLTEIIKRIDQETLEFLSNKSNGLSRRVQLFYDMLSGHIFAKIQYKIFLTSRSFYRMIKNKYPKIRE